MKPTIKDVGRLAGVSFKTVSRVINRENSVGEALQRKVWAAVETLDYQPNISARQLRGAPSFIAFIYDNPNCHFLIEMQHGIFQRCREDGFELLIHPVDTVNTDVDSDLARLASHGHIAGLILTPPFSESQPLINALLAKNISFVRIVSGARPPDTLAPSVYVDDHSAAFEMTDYLLELGHRRIGFLGGEMVHQSGIERLNGYLAALAHRGVAVDKTIILGGAYSFDSGSSRTRTLLATSKPPSAIFAANDEIAAGALFAARIADVAVPKELSIVGFENSPFSRQSWPKLTTAHQPISAIAQRAADLLIQHIRSARSETQDAYGIASDGFLPYLVVRESTCPNEK